MWGELIPFIGVMTACVFLPQAIQPALNYLRNGYTTSRCENGNIRDFYGFKRDEHLVGSIYKPQGLEAIPDEI